MINYSLDVKKQTSFKLTEFALYHAGVILIKLLQVYLTSVAIDFIF